jgi:heterodisulfide reductase subunit B
MTKVVLYPGCVMPTEQYAYEMSLRQVLSKLDIELIDVKGFSCCGTPLKSVNQMVTLTLSARNLALAEQEGHDILAPCSICHLGLSEAKYVLDADPTMKNRVNSFLADENLTYNGTSKLYHTIDFFHDVVTVDPIKKAVKTPLKDMKIATHYGCHLIRPSEIGRPDDAENPQKMETLLKALGAQPLYYPEKLDCCGGLLTANLPESALTKTGQKLQRIQEQGFHVLADACPWCHRQFDAKQPQAAKTVGGDIAMPVMYLTQLMGVAFGIQKEKLGFQLNQSPLDKVQFGGK